MLAIQRENPQAFIKGNINRLKSGQVLRIPDRRQIASITVREAIADVSRQNNEWSSGRRVAQLDATRISSPVTPKAPSSDSAGKLAIVTGDSVVGQGQDLGGGDAGSNPGLQNELAMTREQLDQASRENSELRSRLQSLDEQVATLERLLVVKEDQLAALQERELDVESPINSSSVNTLAQSELAQPEPVMSSDETDYQGQKFGIMSFLFSNPLFLAVLGIIPFGGALYL